MNLRIAHHRILLWLLAFFITISSAVYQHMTGPTHPKRGRVMIDEARSSYKLLRSYTVEQDAPVAITVPDTSISGYVRYVRYKSNDTWQNISFQRDSNKLVAHLPHQPAAGKLAYFVYLEKNGQKQSLTGEEPVVLRYKGDVPAAILLPHILIIFLAMLFSNYTGLQALDAQGKAYRYMLLTIGFFLVGGFILGPLMQKYAFGALWTGFPFGIDLTDNKTLIAMLGWIWAWFQNRNGKDGRGWIVFAAILMLAVYLIPHSVLGSELDYTKLPE